MVLLLLASCAFAPLTGAVPQRQLPNVFRASSLIAIARNGRSRRSGRGPCRFVVRVAILLVAGLAPRAATAQAVAPLQWASTVADFNADGRADVAVAHRATGNDGSNYRIDVRLSNGHRQSVSFVSANRLLAVRVLDVDHDHDLDLVVMPLLGHDVVAVWLNDGTGHFRKGADDTIPQQSAAITTTSLRSGGAPLAVGVPTSRRISDALACAPRPPSGVDGSCIPAKTSDSPRESLSPFHCSPRGPPVPA